MMPPGGMVRPWRGSATCCKGAVAGSRPEADVARCPRPLPSGRLVFSELLRPAAVQASRLALFDMSKSKYSVKVKARPARRPKPFPRETRGGTAPPHQPLVNNLVHVFVDDQNLFWGFVTADRGTGYRFDFGRLRLLAARSSQGHPRGGKTAYVPGVMPEDG